MSRGSFLIVTVLVLALAGMFVWTLSLHGEVQQLRLGGDGGEAAPGADRKTEQRLAALEGRFDELDQEMGSTRVDVSELESEVDGLRSAAANRDAKLAALAEGSPLPVAESGGAPALKEQIEEVITAREEAERRERMERRIQGMSRFLLADVEATDRQRSEFTTILMSWYDERRRIGEEYSGEDADAASREEAVRRVTESRNSKLLRVFGAADYAKIEERLDRGRRWRDGRTGGRRGPRSGGR